MVLGIAAIIAGASEPVVLRQGLVLEPVGRAGRNTLFTDAVEAQVVAGRWGPPRAGDEVILAQRVKLVWQAESKPANSGSPAPTLPTSL